MFTPSLQQEYNRLHFDYQALFDHLIKQSPVLIIYTLGIAYIINTRERFSVIIQIEVPL